MKDVISEVNDAVYLGEGPNALFSGFSKMVDDAIIGNNKYLQDAVYLLIIYCNSSVKSSSYNANHTPYSISSSHPYV